MGAAAKNLVPVTLELGGKSPVIIDKNASIEKAAKSIVFGKLLNTGQTCIAPDYVLVHSSCKQPLIEALKRHIELAMGPDVLHNPEFPKIITKEKLHHLVELLDGCTILYGGSHSQDRLEPPLVDMEINSDHPLMQEEIFGPILPILEFDEIQKAVSFVTNRPKPLAFYLFTNDHRLAKRIIASIPFGGGCINDTIMHIGNPRMPFGGVGFSGMGAYHGHTGFDTFSHRKSILRKSLLFDVPMRYHPYKPQYMNMIKRFLH
jgi:aldehyde dehydrogenase (NAD+)